MFFAPKYFYITGLTFVSRILSRIWLFYMVEVSPSAPTVLFSFCFCCYWWIEGLELLLYPAYGCRELHQLRHHCRIVNGQEFIFLCQSLHPVPLVMHSLCDLLQWLYCFMVLLWSGGEVHCRYFTLPWCNYLFMRWWTISIALCVIDRKIRWRLSMSWGRCIFDVILWFYCWMFPFVTEGKSLFTTSWRRKSSALLILQIPAPFLVGIWVRRGVLIGHMPPSYWPSFPQGIFHLSPHMTWRDVVLSLGPSHVQILSNDPLSMIGIPATLPWWFALLSPNQRRCSVRRVLGFSGRFRS